MIEFVITLGVLLLVVVGMSVGVIMGRKPIKGSCGGIGAALGEKDYVCEICGNDPAKCDEPPESAPAKSLAYDAAAPQGR
ncbi:MAG: (Na+)-NQR maturation NqrM [Bacteroidales bacterium]|nr:(Na+)-NQR maturation NqrM [Bacteroidales bacterium]